MDFGTNTENLFAELKTNQENALLQIVKELCSQPDSDLSSTLKGKVNRIIADCNLKHYSSLHKVSTADESTASLLGFMKQTSTELTFNEQAELNQAFISKIEKKLPTCISELEHLMKAKDTCVKLRKEKVKEMKERDSNVNTLQEQESEQMELMLEWLNHRLNGVTNFNRTSSELLVLKTKILDMKSKIMHLQILQNIFTETNQSIKAYSEVHKDLKDAIKETEHRINQYKEVIENDCKDL